MYKQYNIKKIVSYFGFTLLNKKTFFNYSHSYLCFYGQ